MATIDLNYERHDYMEHNPIVMYRYLNQDDQARLIYSDDSAISSLVIPYSVFEYNPPSGWPNDKKKYTLSKLRELLEPRHTRLIDTLKKDLSFYGDIIEALITRSMLHIPAIRCSYPLHCDGIDESISVNAYLRGNAYTGGHGIHGFLLYDGAAHNNTYFDVWGHNYENNYYDGGADNQRPIFLTSFLGHEHEDGQVDGLDRVVRHESINGPEFHECIPALPSIVDGRDNMIELGTAVECPTFEGCPQTHINYARLGAQMPNANYEEINFRGTGLIDGILLNTNEARFSMIDDIPDDPIVQILGAALVAYNNRGYAIQPRQRKRVVQVILQAHIDLNLLQDMDRN